jgi:hypothetical protein
MGNVDGNINYALLDGLRISGEDTGNTIYNATRDIAITRDTGGFIRLQRQGETAIGLSVDTTTGAVIVGTDPGSNQALRVGGDINLGNGKNIYFGTSSTDFRLRDSAGSPTALEVITGDASNYANFRALRLYGTAAIIAGTDPGGPEPLRIGGGAFFDGAVSMSQNTDLGPYKQLIIANIGLTAGSNAQDREMGAVEFRTVTDTRVVRLVGYISGSDAGTNLNSFKIIVGNTDVPLKAFNISSVGKVDILVGPLVIGSDPGGSGFLRVGGEIRIGSTADAKITQTKLNAGTDEKVWDWLLTATQLQGRAVNDADNNANNWITITRSGFTVPTVAFPNGAVVIGSDPGGAASLRIGAVANGDEGLRMGAVDGILNYALIDGLRISGEDTGNTIYNAGRDIAITRDTGGFVRLQRQGETAIGLSVDTTTGAVIVGTDPGAGLLRVGGGGITMNGEGNAFVWDASSLRRAGLVKQSGLAPELRYTSSIDLAVRRVTAGTLEAPSTSDLPFRFLGTGGVTGSLDDGSTLKSALAGVVVSTSNPATEDYPQGTIWVKY